MEVCENSINRKRVFLRAFFVRLILLIVIICFTSFFEEGFIESSNYYDDYRYEQGAIAYSESASDIIDVNAFTSAYASVGDWVGYNFVENPLNASPLWYWIACVLVYIFKTKWAIRVFNIIVASAAIVKVGEFSSLLCDAKATRMVILLLTYLPYPAIFSCFAYKDQLIMLCTFYLLCAALKYRYFGEITKKRVVIIIVFSVALLFTRGGLTAVLLALCALLAFVKDFHFKIEKKQAILFALVAIVVIAVLSRSFGTIIYKLQYYFARHEETLGDTSIGFIAINGVRDIYKLPFTYIFSIIMPIGLFGKISSWYSIVANCNVIMTPIAVGATLYIFKRDKIDRVVYWGCLALYLISIVTSINIFRHYYSLMPLTLVFFSDYWTKSSNQAKSIVIILSLLFALLLIAYYGIR